MKVKPICAICLLERGFKQAKMATDDEELQRKVVKQLLKFLAKNFDLDRNPAYFGYLRDQIVKEVIFDNNDVDLYSKLKKRSNEIALDLLPSIREWVEEAHTPKERFRRACIVSIVGNIIEFDIRGHNFDLKDLPKVIEDAENELVIDDIEKVFYLIQKGAKNVLFLTDNAGEIVFDTLLVDELKKNGCHVTVAVKEKPIMNDATMDDAIEVGMDNVADKVITTGAFTAGLNLNDASEEFMQEYKKADLIIAKGMGHFETLPEFDHHCPVVHLLRTKCEPVANALGVDRHRNVAKLS